MFSLIRKLFKIESEPGNEIAVITCDKLPVVCTCCSEENLKNSAVRPRCCQH